MRAFISAFLLFVAGPAPAELVHLGSYEWTSNHPRFGGFSAIEVSDNGRDFVAISDRGLIARGSFDRVDGMLAGIKLNSFDPFISSTGTDLSRADRDSEGLAVDSDGQIYVSFEWRHGVRRVNGNTMGALMRTDAFSAMQPNSSLEALALDAGGALFVIPERSGRPTRPFPVWRLIDGNWDVAFEIPRRGPFLVTGADIGPDGRFYILERDFVLVGFRTRIRRFGPDGSGEETLLETDVLTHDNLEGISVWEDAEGLRLTLISDDNYRSWQRTEIVEYRLTDD